MKNLKKAAWTTLAVLSSLLALFTLLLIGVQTADWIKYGYRSTDLKYVLLAGGFSIAMAVLAVLGIRMAGKIREKQPALSGAPLQVSDMRREPERKIYRSAPRLLAAEFGKKLIFLGFFCILAASVRKPKSVFKPSFPCLGFRVDPSGTSGSAPLLPLGLLLVPNPH